MNILNKTPVAGPRREDALDRLLDAARTEGVLPAEAVRPVDDSRPWPIVLLTALGAWLAAIPFISALMMLIGESFGLFMVIGVFLVVGCALVLRARRMPFFFEQMAIPALLLGYYLLAAGLGDMSGLDHGLPQQIVFAILLLINLVLAGAIPHPWLRALLGAGSAVWLQMILLPVDSFFFAPTRFTLYLALHGATLGVLCVGLLLLWLQRRVLYRSADIRLASIIEPFAGGWLLMVLASLIWLSVMAWMSGTWLLGMDKLSADETGPWWLFLRGLSLMMVVAAGCLLARAWPGQRSLLLGLLTVVFTALAYWMTLLGCALFVLAVGAVTHRWRLAAAAALTAAWIIGIFYFQLDWPLATKALILAACGVVLGVGVVIDRLLRRNKQHNKYTGRSGQTGQTGQKMSAGDSCIPDPSMDAPRRWATALIAASVVVTLALINYSIWEKENLIAHGQVVYVRLTPVDPRSLMQGDYMRLNFDLPPTLDELRRDGVGASTKTPKVAAETPKAVYQRDSRGVARFVRVSQPGEPLAEDELLIEPVFKGGHWILVTDAWFFREGDAERWQKARYGEFRVTPNGKALLVGMADEELQAIPIGKPEKMEATEAAR